MSLDEIQELIYELKKDTPKLYKVCSAVGLNYTSVKRRLDKGKLTFDDVKKLASDNADLNIEELL